MTRRQICLLTLVSQLASLATADWQYRSRPDLSPPKLNITVPAAASTAPGYIFTAPYLGFDPGSTGPEQPGAYIFTNDGDLVWSATGYLAGWVADFGPTVVDGRLVLRAFQGGLDAPHGRMYGDHVLLDDHYEAIKTVRAGSHRLVSCHEFQVLEGETVLIETPVSIPTDLSPYGGDENQTWVVTNGFQELDIQTGQVLFEWYSYDHVSPKYTHFPLEETGPFGGRSSFDAWNYFHINSVDKDDEGNYLVSARNYAAIFKINGSDGAILWQLGGRAGSDFEVPASVQFAHQHDARFRSRSADGTIEQISFFDNAMHTVPGHTLNPFSRARIVELNHTAGTASEVRTYTPPDALATKSQGNVQLLANGNVFVNWGQAGAVTEYAEDGEVLFHAYLDSEPSRNVQSYRGFRAEWTGFSPEEPAVLAVRSQQGRLTVYVSWNGDTETRTWQFYLVVSERNGQVVKSIGKAKRTGFETVFTSQVAASLVGEESVRVLAEALDSRGRSLGKSSAIRVQDDAFYPWESANVGVNGQYSSDQIRLEL
ncbi:secreted protein [Aspergillus violaceofuscus CBS 115571]|uniref:Secreted protein n=1 Tax=Aspergillus violaceofuscus (strain CBS 115571) TaxID=1450538 RepID=A0A2V5GUU5_ASPV1|nr:secreted protein [Aspergillus violaceofuscus CBS 115571]